MVGACVYIRERGERVEDAQSVNRNARTRTHTPRPRFLLPPTSTLFFTPSPQGKHSLMMYPDSSGTLELGSSG